MPTTTRTLGPLHLEDLEPHRFEDMVRQLLYDFRVWSQLEATGRAGSDDSFDVRGWEIVTGQAEPVEEDEDGATPTVEESRIWLIQCKREKAIGPKKLLGYLDDIPEDERVRLHGIVFVAACDFSKKARDEFRAKIREFGLAEGYLWGKGEIEDQLYQPKNDHLLFAYFGISLQVRRRTLQTELRAKLAMKRKAKRLLKKRFPVLIRDATDDRYPYLDEDDTKDRKERGRWHVMFFGECMSDGLHICHRRHFAFIDDDGEHWDYAERMNDKRLHSRDDPWEDRNDEQKGDRQAAEQIWDALPEYNRAWYELFVILPYENILDIDDEGDEYCRRPHIYTARFRPPAGPFRDFMRVSLQTVDRFRPRPAPADEGKRVEKFPRAE